MGEIFILHLASNTIVHPLENIHSIRPLKEISFAAISTSKDYHVLSKHP
jgi:hypothetical protein